MEMLPKMQDFAIGVLQYRNHDNTSIHIFEEKQKSQTTESIFLKTFPNISNVDYVQYHISLARTVDHPLPSNSLHAPILKHS